MADVIYHRSGDDQELASGEVLKQELVLTLGNIGPSRASLFANTSRESKSPRSRLHVSGGWVPVGVRWEFKKSSM